MPRITEYSAPEGIGLRPSETGINATAAAARRVQGEYNEAAADIAGTGQRFAADVKIAGDIAVKYVDHQEISAGLAHGAQMFDQLTESKDKVVKDIDPYDPAYGRKVEAALKQWREDNLEPALQNFKDGFNTEKSQEWAQRYIGTTREHMFHSTAADISTAAGIGVKNSIRTFANVASNTALRDPSSVPAQLDLAEHSIAGLVQSSPLKGVNAASIQSEVLEKTREQIVKAGAVGAIQKAQNPEEEAQNWVKKYPQYINGQEAVTLASNARQQIRARNYDDATARRRDREEKADRSDEAANQYLIDVRSRDPKFKDDPTAQKILNDPNLLKRDKNNLLNLVDRQLKPETDARISRETFVGLLRDLRDPNAESDKVMQKAWDARLTDPGKAGSLAEGDFIKFRQEVIDRKTPEGLAIGRDRTEFFKQYGASIDPEMKLGNPSAIGAQKLYAAEQDAKRQEEALRKAGKDPHALYDPQSEYFLGSKDRLSKYRFTLQEKQEYDAQLKRDKAQKRDDGPKVGDRKQFKQGVGVWNGTTYVPEKQ